MKLEYDVLVIGSGPAGFYSALCCAKGGLKTAIAEHGETGGTGVAKGCLPVKIIASGSAGASQSDIAIGDLIISTGSVRED